MNIWQRLLDGGYWLREQTPWRHKTNLTKRRPPGWKASLLASYLELMWSNTIGTFANLGEARRVQDIDALLNHFLQNTSQVKNKAAVSVGLPLLLCIRAHAAFRAGAALAMSGAIQEATAPLRLSLETAGYAMMMQDNEALGMTWLNRGDSEVDKAKARQTFRHSEVRDSIMKRDAQLGDVYQKLYEFLIDGGAHPNEQGFMRNMQVIENEDGGCKMLQIYLQADGNELHRGTRMVSKIGVCILMLMENMYPEVIEQLGISERIPAVSARL